MSGDNTGNYSRRGFLRAVSQATAASAAACLLPGCGPTLNLGLFQKTNKIPAMTAPPDSMRLDVVFAERPVGDALLGKLWQNVDQVASLPGTVRDQLQRNGFRVGVTSSDPPEALQTLLGLKSDFAYEPAAEKAKHMVGRQVLVRAEGETEIEAGPVCDECTVVITDGQKSVARSYTQCRGTFKVVAHRLQDGWAKLDFVPVVLHGAESLHHVAGSENWQFANGQRTEVYHSQRFQLELGVGEMVVISTDETAGESLGHMFFIGKSHLHDAPALNMENTAVQRVLVVRLAEMPRNEDPYAKTG